MSGHDSHELTENRDNIDPTGICKDADLNDSLSLIHSHSSASSSLREKCHLAALVVNEGSNFNAGERHLCGLS